MQTGKPMTVAEVMRRFPRIDLGIPPEVEYIYCGCQPDTYFFRGKMFHWKPEPHGARKVQGPSVGPNA